MAIKQIKQQTNNVNLDVLILENEDLIKYIKEKPDILPSVVNYLDEYQKYMLLEYFCILGELKNVACLVSHGADIHTGNEHLLYVAVIKGHLDVVKYLVSKGADIHVNYEGPLCTAVTEGRSDIVEYLISKGADISHLNSCGQHRVLKFLSIKKLP